MDQTRLLYAQKKAIIDRSLGIVANNLANASTTGFQQELALEESRAAKYRGADVISYPQHSGTTRLTDLGNLEASGNPLDFALGKPDTYFAVLAPDGQIFYTRDGHASVSPQGVLVTAGSGYPLLDQDGKNIEIPQDAKNFSVMKSGLMAADDQPVGTMGVFHIPPDQLKYTEKRGKNLLKITGDRFAPQPAQHKEVLQGHIEGSNVQATVMMVKLLALREADARMLNILKEETKQQLDSSDRLLVSS